MDGGSAGRPRADLMERGDIYLVSLDPTAGHEQQGKRPVLVISPSKFNRLTGVPVVLPITTGGGFARTAGFAVSLMGAGLQTTGVVRCDQPRALDLKGAQRQEARNRPRCNYRRGPEQGRPAVRVAKSCASTPCGSRKFDPAGFDRRHPAFGLAARMIRSLKSCRDDPLL